MPASTSSSTSARRARQTSAARERDGRRDPCREDKERAARSPAVPHHLPAERPQQGSLPRPSAPTPCHDSARVRGSGARSGRAPGPLHRRDAAVQDERIARSSSRRAPERSPWLKKTRREAAQGHRLRSSTSWWRKGACVSGTPKFTPRTAGAHRAHVSTRGPREAHLHRVRDQLSDRSSRLIIRCVERCVAWPPEGFTDRFVAA